MNHRRSIRLQDYDYAQDNAYFVTICTHHRAALFGAVVDGEMTLNTLGCIVLEEWERTATLRPYIELVGTQRAASGAFAPSAVSIC